MTHLQQNALFLIEILCCGFSFMSALMYIASIVRLGKYQPGQTLHIKHGKREIAMLCLFGLIFVTSIVAMFLTAGVKIS